MFKKHLVVLLLLFSAVVAFSQSIPSGTGRIEALGYSPFILDAATDINNNPAWTTMYRNYAFGDIGRDVVSSFELTNQYAGVNTGWGKKWNIGLIVNKEDDQYGNFQTETSRMFSPDSNGIKGPIVPIKLQFGLAVNKDFAIGLAPYIAMWNSEWIPSSAIDSKSSSTAIGADLGIIKQMKKNWFEAAVKFRLNSYKNAYTDSAYSRTVNSQGGLDLSIALRGWFYTNTPNKMAVVPVLGFSTFSWNPQIAQSGPTFDSTGTSYSWMTIYGGAGLNCPVTDDIQLAGGLTVSYNQMKGTNGTYTNKRTDFYLPEFYLSGETRIADWLTARFGFNRSIDMYKDAVTVGSTTTSYSETTPNGNPGSNLQTISLGAGFHFSRFSIDATVSEKWLKQGIYFVSGEGDALFGVVSASYNFNAK